MQHVSEMLAAKLGSEVVSLCLCWKLTRQDGVIIGVTDHNKALDINGVVYDPGDSLSDGIFSQSSGLKPGRAAAEGVLSSGAISEEDLVNGLWNRARVDVYRADWKSPDLGSIAVWHGYLSQIEQTPSGAFEAELISLKSDLERPVGRLLQRRCDAILGDARCGITSIEGRTCDQRFETCRDVFGNTENYRGFPHMPGTDFVLAGPSASGNTGGKR